MSKHALAKRIEEELDKAWNSENPLIRKEAEAQAQYYGERYKELTGHYYVRECKR